MNYVPANIFFTNGDTITGFIDYRHWPNSPEKISFRQSINSTEKIYYPFDLKAFTVGGEKYYSAITKVDAGIINKDNELKELVTITDTIFLLMLIDGEKSLFSYRNKHGQLYYYIKNDTGFEILEYKIYLSKYEGKNAIHENKKYTGQLMSYLNECDMIPKMLQDIKYKYNDLLKLFKAYNECKGLKTESVAETKKISANFGVLAGVSISTLKLSATGSMFPLYEQQEYKPSINFSAGLYSHLFLLKNKKISLVNNLMFASYKMSDSYTNDEFIQETLKTELSYSYLKLHTLCNFRIPVKKAAISFNFGISNGMAVSRKFKITSETIFATHHTEGDDRAYELGFVFGSGVDYNRYSLDIKFEHSNGMLDRNYLKSFVNRYYFLLGYRF